MSYFSSFSKFCNQRMGRRYEMHRLAMGRLLAIFFSVMATIVPGLVSAESVTLETPLVTGSDVVVTVADYRQALLALPQAQRRTVENDATRRLELLFELYTEQMLAHEARRRDLDKQPDVQAEIDRSSRKILVDAILKQERTEQAQPDFTALAEEYYQTHRKNYFQPERIRVAHILWSMKCDCEAADGSKRAQAETVLKELRTGADFAELARKYSDDKTSAIKAGGDLGQWITRGVLVKPFEEVAFALPEPGAISDVVKTEYGYHIIKLLAREPEGIQPFEQVKGSIIEKLSGIHQSSAHKAFVGQYYPTAEQFNKAAIDTMLFTVD